MKRLGVNKLIDTNFNRKMNKVIKALKAPERIKLGGIKVEKIELDKRDLLALIVASTKLSCGFGGLMGDNWIWEFHCCDYNEPVYKLAKQLKGVDFEDEEYNKFVKEVNRVGDGYYIKEEEE